MNSIIFDPVDSNVVYFNFCFFRLLFWTDWDANRPRIEKCSMSGQERLAIFNVSSIEGAGWPNGLTADYDASRLYWIDAR